MDAKNEIASCRLRVSWACPPTQEDLLCPLESAGIRRHKKSNRRTTSQTGVGLGPRLPLNKSFLYQGLSPPLKVSAVYHVRARSQGAPLFPQQVLTGRKTDSACMLWDTSTRSHVALPNNVLALIGKAFALSRQHGEMIWAARSFEWTKRQPLKLIMTTSNLALGRTILRFYSHE